MAAFALYQTDTANTSRDFATPDVSTLTGTNAGDVIDFGIDFGNYVEGSWYSQQELKEILAEAKDIEAFKGTSGTTVFRTDDLILLGETDGTATDKQKAGTIAFRRFDARRDAAALADGAAY